jgi:Fur family ferric uptake transcriptional regulator
MPCAYAIHQCIIENVLNTVSAPDGRTLMLDRLSDAGFRLTAPRRRVLAALREASAPATAHALAARARTSLASTYRTLALLVNLGLAGEVAESGAPDQMGADTHSRRYTLCSSAGHHHHFVCRSCHTTVEVASEPLERALADLAAHHGLRIEEHEITLRGRCARCGDGSSGAPDPTAARSQRAHDHGQEVT